VVVGQADGGSRDPGEADNDEPAETAETTADGDA
jgi:hypothetical protein